MVTIVAVAMMAGGGTGALITPEVIAFQKEKAALIAAADRSIAEARKVQAESAAAIIKAQESLARVKAAVARAQAKEAAEKAEADRRRKDK